MKHNEIKRPKTQYEIERDKDTVFSGMFTGYILGAVTLIVIMLILTIKTITNLPDDVQADPEMAQRAYDEWQDPNYGKYADPDRLCELAVIECN